eukprot:CAMPEP_0184711006 /NCGR_PEP_ID=MMETSP0314-20130426/1728_1 /TAXON_ID=38298 /ORGANISM="Rhodella maculata, Strain CCMP 736" /LENGTH=86 /DNA_ID=CAMNT_0027172993 /DNA_START=47 /DNA_END=307 /DNA_ORIENTATION=+
MASFRIRILSQRQTRQVAECGAIHELRSASEHSVPSPSSAAQSRSAEKALEGHKQWSADMSQLIALAFRAEEPTLSDMYGTTIGNQ